MFITINFLSVRHLHAYDEPKGLFYRKYGYASCHYMGGIIGLPSFT